MAPAKDVAVEASLPKLLALDKRHSNLDERIKEATSIAGIPLSRLEGHNESKGPSSSFRPSRTRSEFALRWTLEKLKTPENRKACQESLLIWPFLRQLIQAIPESSVARYLQSSDFVSNVGSFLAESADALSRSTTSGPPVIDEDDGKKRKTSKKRKRGEKEPSPPAGDVAAKFQSLHPATLGAISVLRGVIARATADGTAVDSASKEHLSSAMRTSAEDASKILDAWLRCLIQILAQTSADDALLEAHRAILYVWEARSREQNDETGASPKVFSSSCLISTVTLLHALHAKFDGSPVITELKTSLEQLLANHVLLPGRTLFDTAQTAKHAEIKRSRSALDTFLEPLKNAIAKNGGKDETAIQLLSIIPHILDLTIRLSPGSTPSQQSAQLPWLESVFAALSTCAMEPLPHDDATPHLADVHSSPLIAMLNVLRLRNVRPVGEFLEIVLLGYSGLKGLRDSSRPLRLDVVAALLDIDGGIFLRDPKKTEEVGQSSYVDALVGSLSEISWTGSTSAASGEDHTTSAFAVQRLLTPLLRAYVSARKLPSFISLWFWEIRRQWKTMGTPLEAQSPWLSQELLQIFRQHLEVSLSTTRVSELLVEFILPVRQLVDETTRATSSSLDWTSIPSAAPACAALAILDALLHGVEREETLSKDGATWKALGELPVKLAMLDMRGFPASARVWSILKRVYTLSFWVDGKEGFLEKQKSLLEGGDVFGKAVEISVSSGSKVEGLAANEFVIVVCGFELDASMREKATEALKRVNGEFLDAIEKLSSDSDGLLRLRQTLTWVIRYPATLSLMDQDRHRLFTAVVEGASRDGQQAMKGLLDSLIATLVDGDLNSLRDLISVLCDFVTIKSQQDSEGLAINSLLAIQPNLIPRPRREQVLDNIACLQPQRVTTNLLEEEAEFAVRGVALLVRLLSLPSPTARLCIEPAKAFELVEVLETLLQQRSGNVRFLQSINGLFTLIMNQALHDATDERREKYVDAFIQVAEERASKSLANLKAKKSGFKSPLLILVLKCFLASASGNDGMRDRSAELNEQLFSILKKTGSLGSQDSTWSWIQHRTISDLGKPTKGNANAKILELAPRLLEDHQDDGNMATATKMEIESMLDSKIPIKSFLVKLDATPHAQEYCKVLDIFARQVETSRVQHKLNMAAKLLEKGNSNRLQLLHTVIKNLSPDEVSELDPPKLLLVQLCRILIQTSDIKEFGSAIACITTILRSKTFLVTQNGIDTLLHSLTTLSSPQAPSLPPEHAGFIYGRVCHLVTSTILLHRRRLGGRMHLLVPLLQNLLGCLYSPHRYQASAASARPPWLQATRLLNVEDAVSFTRVLTTLCSPTVSSTISHRGFRMADAGLVDETKKAKEYAGRYVSYVLLHYCTLQLQGTVTSEVAEKLKMGLWAMMEVVDIEAMRGMNAGMGREERVVWGALYAEWNRLGRFKLT